MFRMSGSILANNKILKECVSRQDSTSMSRTEKIITSLNEICEYMDLAVPIWLEKNISDFKRTDKTRFRADNFLEDIDFDFLSIEIIEE